MARRRCGGLAAGIANVVFRKPQKLQGSGALQAAGQCLRGRCSAQALRLCLFLPWEAMTRKLGKLSWMFEQASGACFQEACAGHRYVNRTESMLTSPFPDASDKAHPQLANHSSVPKAELTDPRPARQNYQINDLLATEQIDMLKSRGCHESSISLYS